MSSAAFESFWQIYPKKVGKAVALKKWEAKKLDEYAPAIVTHLKQRVRDDKKWKDGFILDPATFLNQERWTDEYEKITYRQPESKPLKEVEYFPQPHPYKAAINRLIVELMRTYPKTPFAAFSTLIAKRDLWADKLMELLPPESYPSGVPANVWRPYSEKMWRALSDDLGRHGSVPAERDREEAQGESLAA